MWGQILAGGIYQLHRIEIGASRDFINNKRLPPGVTPFAVNNQFLVLSNELHNLVKITRHNPNHVDERPPRKKVVASVHV